MRDKGYIDFANTFSTNIADRLMMDYSKFPNRQIACIDMMSFYASCMAALHNLDVRTVPIAVVGNLNKKDQSCWLRPQP